MQHGTLLNVWLILLVHYGQTDDICGAGKIRRGDKCCLSEICENTGFAACIVNNTKDICTPCSEGFYLIGQYETSYFPDPNVCALKKKCFPEEVKNANGECVCDVSRGYYRIDEGICGLVQISCTPAGRQLSQNGHCDPCPEGYFKPVSGKQRCRKKSNITCSSTEIILEGNTTTDRKCVKNDVIVSTSTYSPPLSTSINITNDVIDRNGNDTILKWVIIAVVVFAIVLSFVVVVIQLVCHRCLRRRQQSQDLENHEHDEHVPLRPVNGELPIVDLENDENTVHVSLQRMNGAIPIVDVDTVDIGTDPYPSPQDNIPNVTGRPQVVEDSNDNESPSCGVEVVTCVNSQTYVKLPYPSNGSSIDNGVRGDTSISNRDEDNSNQDDGSFNPLSREDVSCPGAVGGDIDGNDQTTSDTASLFNNETDVQNFNPLNYQPSSEHNLQQDRMVLGPRSFPVQNPDPNLPLPLPPYHGGYSDEDDSGFQN